MIIDKVLTSKTNHTLETTLSSINTNSLRHSLEQSFLQLSDPLDNKKKEKWIANFQGQLSYLSFDGANLHQKVKKLILEGRKIQNQVNHVGLM